MQLTLMRDKYPVLAMDNVLNLTDDDNMVVKIMLMFFTAVHFFSTSQVLKAWLELSRVNLYKNDL